MTTLEERVSNIEKTLEEILKETKRQSDELTYQNRLLEILTEDDMINNQKLISAIHRIVSIPPDEAFMINVNANIYATLLQKLLWGDEI